MTVTERQGETVGEKLPKKGSQAWKILEYLKAGNTLTSREAVELFGVLRLPNRISELRNQYGITIYQRTIWKGRGGGSVHWSEYSLTPFEKAVPVTVGESS